MGWRCICLLLGAVTAAPTGKVRGRRAAADTATAETAAADIVRRVLAGPPTFDDERGAVVVPAGPDCTSALNEAMLAANSAGGGTVATRDGAAYELDGPLNLLSHVRLRVGRGTTLRFGYSAPQRPPVLRSAEGVVFHGPSPLVRACVEITFTARSSWIATSTSTPSTRHLLDGVAVWVSHRSTEPARPRTRHTR